MKNLVILCSSFFLISGTSHSQEKSCDSILNASRSDQNLHLEEALNEVPNLKSSVELFLNSPEFPSHLKALFKKALSGNEVEIHNLTYELKTSFGVSHRVASRFEQNDQAFDVKPSTHENANQAEDAAFAAMRSAKAAEGWFQKRYTILVDDFGPYIQSHPFLKLVHELSHVRMEKFLAENIHSLVGRFPQELLSLQPNGRVIIEADFYSYLHERYAYEMELDAALAMVRMVEDDTLVRQEWSNYLYADLEYAHTLLAKRIQINYRLAGDYLFALHEIPLHRILLNGFK